LCLTEIAQVVKAVEAAEAKNRVPDDLKHTHPYSSLALWTFYARTHHDAPGEICRYCQFFDGQTFTGSQLRSVFPDHRWEGTDIYPDVHKTLWGRDGECTCLLIREPESPSLNLSIYSGVGGDWRDKFSEEET
jgi:hypothetical protein